MKYLSLLGTACLFSWFGANVAHAHCGHSCHHYSDYGPDCGYHCGPGGARGTGTAMPDRSGKQATVEGKITEIVYLPGRSPENSMVEVLVESGGQSHLARLAPSGVLRQSGLALREGETITIRGFAVAGLEGDLTVATRISQGSKIAILRDNRGRPIW